MIDASYIRAMQGDDTSLSNTAIIAAYESGIEELKSAVAGMTPAQLIARPIPGKLSSIEVVGHIVDMDLCFADRIIRTIAMDHPLLMSADEDQYFKRIDYQSYSIDEQLSLFSALRRHVIRILRQQTDEVWQRTAVHSGTGLLTLRQLVLNPTRHARHHVPFIHAKREALLRG